MHSIARRVAWDESQGPARASIRKPGTASNVGGVQAVQKVVGGGVGSFLTSMEARLGATTIGSIRATAHVESSQQPSSRWGSTGMTSSQQQQSPASGVGTVSLDPWGGAQHADSAGANSPPVQQHDQPQIGCAAIAIVSMQVRTSMGYPRIGTLIIGPGSRRRGQGGADMAGRAAVFRRIRGILRLPPTRSGKLACRTPGPAALLFVPQ
jgi:hypothetical protein